MSGAQIMKILFTGGGTAGHIYPLIAIAREMRGIYQKYQKEDVLEFYYVGPKDEFSETMLSQEGFIIKTIMAGKIRRYFELNAILQNIADFFFRIPVGFFQGFIKVFLISPDLIFSKGGYGSFSVVLSGWMLLTPVFLHESDAVPGLVNKMASKFSLEVFVSFPMEKTEYFPSGKMISVGNPLRKEVLDGDKEKAKELFKLSGKKPIILFLGGSQGSQRINDMLMVILPGFLEGFELIHQTGHKNFKQTEAESKVVLNEKLQKFYHITPFLNEQEVRHALAVADLVVSRAGAGSIFEIAAAGKPSVLIPLPESAQSHQLKNAYNYAEAGACLVIEEINLTPHFFLEQIRYLFSQSNKLKTMGESAREFSRPQAAKIVARYILEYLLQ